MDANGATPPLHPPSDLPKSDMSRDGRVPLPSPFEQDPDVVLIRKFVREAAVEEAEDTDGPTQNSMDTEQLSQ